MVTNGFCPTPTKSCPSDSHEADAMDETEFMLTHHSPISDMQEKPKSSSDSVQNQPVGINSWLASEDYSTSFLVKREKKCSLMVSPDEVAKVKEKVGMKIHVVAFSFLSFLYHSFPSLKTLTKWRLILCRMFWFMSQIVSK